jgi:hypothetical protein
LTRAFPALERGAPIIAAMPSLLVKGAAITGVAALGAAAGAAITAPADPARQSAAAPRPAAAAPAEVRTQVVHRTVRVVRREPERERDRTATTLAAPPAAAPRTVAAASVVDDRRGRGRGRRGDDGPEHEAEHGDG